MVIKLVYKEKLFVETSNTETTGDTLATLSIDESNMVASLSFSGDANLIERRTAKRDRLNLCLNQNRVTTRMNCLFDW